MKRIIVFVLTLGIAYTAMAQQDAHYSFYMFNNLYFNPAYTGKKEAVSIEMLHRQQWRFFNLGQDIEGAPQSTTFSVHAPFKRSNNALGFMFHNDMIGPFNNSTFTLSYAYRIPVGQKLKLSFGLRGSYNLYHINDVDFIRPDQVGSQLNALRNLHKFNAGAGVYLWNKRDRFYVGFSVPTLIQNVLYDEVEFNAENSNFAQEHMHFYLTGGVVLGKQDGNVKVYPSTMVKFVQNAPLDFDVNLNFLLYERLWIGAGYRFGGNIFDNDDNNRLIDEFGNLGRGDAVIGMMRVKVSKFLEIGYAYDHTLSALGDFNSGSHEMMINMRFDKRTGSPDGMRVTTPRYVNYF